MNVRRVLNKGIHVEAIYGIPISSHCQVISKLTDSGSGIQRNLILITALQNAGKTSLGKE